MNLVFVVTDNYIKYLYVCLMSLAESNKEEMFHIYVVMGKVSKQNKEEIESFCREQNWSVDFIIVTEKVLDKCGLPNEERFPEVVYYKLILADVLPDTVNRALLLDVDLIIRKNLRRIYDLSISEVYFAAAVDMWNPVIIPEREVEFHRIESDEKHYYNTGVMLWNFAKIRKELPSRWFLTEGLKRKETGEYPEQDLLNALCFEKVMYCSPEWMNFMIAHFRNWFKDGEYKESMEEAVIWHYAGDNPWRTLRTKEWYGEWWRYAQNSPFYIEILEDCQHNLGNNADHYKELCTRMKKVMEKQAIELEKQKHLVEEYGKLMLDIQEKLVQ